MAMCGPSSPTIGMDSPLTRGGNCVSVRCRVRISQRAIDPEFGPCLETMVSFVGDEAKSPSPHFFAHSPLGGGRKKLEDFDGSTSDCPSLLLTTITPALPRAGASPLRDVSPPGGSFAPRGKYHSFGSPQSHPLPGDQRQTRSAPPSTTAGADVGQFSDFDREGPSLSCVDDCPKREDGLPPIHANPNRGTPPSRACSVATETTNASKRSRSRGRKPRHQRRKSFGGTSAFADVEISVSGLPDSPRQSGSGPSTPPSGEETPKDPVHIPLKDVISVDQEIPTSPGNRANVVSEFLSSSANTPASHSGDPPTSSSPVPPPPSSGILAHPQLGKLSLYRIFLHTSSQGYVEFSFDNSNSHDILLAYLHAHLEPNRLPHINTPSSTQPQGVALKTMILTPSRSGSFGTHQENAVEKLQAKVMNRRIQQESTTLERVKENVACWMSHLMDCACCTDTTVAPEPQANEKKTNESFGKRGKASGKMRKDGVGSLSFDESIQSKTKCVIPKLSFERSERSIGAESPRRLPP